MWKGGKNFLTTQINTKTKRYKNFKNFKELQTKQRTTRKELRKKQGLDLEKQK